MEGGRKEGIEDEQTCGIEFPAFDYSQFITQIRKHLIEVLGMFPQPIFAIQVFKLVCSSGSSVI